MSKTHEQAYYSTMEAAKVMHISRVAVLKKIKTGRLVAEKIGRNYAIPKVELEAIIGSKVSPAQSDEIKHAVQKAMKDYREAFKKLSKE
jgi:excisionase family DNA binding protein